MPVPLTQTTLIIDETVAAQLVAQHIVGPVWKGPQSAESQGGISQSMLQDYLSCRERFRVYVIEGLYQPEGFSAPLEMGNLWHAAEEAFANRATDAQADLFSSADGDWQTALQQYADQLSQKYPFDRDKVLHWYGMVQAQFPYYVSWWRSHPDMEKRTPLLSEQTFKVPYRLPSGRTVYLRGKWDSVDLVTEGESAGIWVQENKTKSSIDEGKISRQLKYDLQTSCYLTTLQKSAKIADSQADGWAWTKPIRGVRYNVIRRSAHKTVDSMLKKLNEDISTGRGREWFDRWNVGITAQDLANFKRWTLDPLLENLCDDYEWWSDCYENRSDQFDFQRRQQKYPSHANRHFVYPYGVYNTVADGGFGEVDHYILTGRDTGLARATEMFPELNDQGDKDVTKTVGRTDLGPVVAK